MNLKRTFQMTATAGLITCMSVLVGCSAGSSAAGGGDGASSGASDSGFNISGEISALWERTSFISSAHAGESANPLAALSEMCNSSCEDDTCATLVATAGADSTKICSGDVDGNSFNISMADGAQAVMAELQDTYVFSVETTHLNDDGVVVTKTAVLEISENTPDAELPVNDASTTETGFLFALLPDAANPSEAKNQLNEIKNNFGLGQLIVAVSEAMGNVDVSEDDAQAGLVNLGVAKLVLSAIVENIKESGQDFSIDGLKSSIAANQDLLGNIMTAVNNYKDKLPKNDEANGGSEDSQEDSGDGKPAACANAAACAATGGTYVDPVTAAGFTREKSPVDMYTTNENYIKAGVTAATCTHTWNPESMISSGSCQASFNDTVASCSFDSTSNGVGHMTCMISIYTVLGIDSTQLQTNLQMILAMQSGGSATGGAAAAGGK